MTRNLKTKPRETTDECKISENSTSESEISLQQMLNDLIAVRDALRKAGHHFPSHMTKLAAAAVLEVMYPAMDRLDDQEKS